MTSESSRCSSDIFGALCKICGNDANGTHFGVLTCRACAAFFRRTVVLKLKYHCKNRDHDRKPHINSCRYCRYQNCVEKGMSPENVQWNRDITSSTLNRRKICTSLKVPDIRETPGWRQREAKAPPAFDLTNVFRKIRRILSKHDLPLEAAFTSRNTLEKMEFALMNYRKTRRPLENNIEIVGSYKLEKMVKIWSKMMTSVAEWMMYSEEIRALCAAEKYEMFLHIWHAWVRLDLIQMSCEALGDRVLKEKILMASSTEAFRIDDFRIDFSQITDRPSEDIVTMLLPLLDQLFDGVVRPMLALQPNSTETTYLLCYIACKIASKYCHGNIPGAADAFLECVSNDLHEFYAKTLKTNNYAARLIKFVAVVNSLEKVYKERKKIMELARLFDVFKTKISEPCFFD